LLTVRLNTGPFLFGMTTQVCYFFQTSRVRQTLATPEPTVQTILARRHKAAATTVAGLIIAVVLLSVVAFLGKSYLRRQPSPSLELGVRAAVLILGIGSIMWRRRNLSGARLQAITEKQGPQGVIGLLERTTLQIAVLGAAIAAVGFVATLVSGDDLYTYWAGLIAIVVLLFHYPRRSFWTRVVERFTGDPEISA
jgi:hypothetical protein